MIDLCIVPMGVGLSVSKEIAIVEKILRDPKYDLECMLHGYGTNIRGSWDNVFGALKECHEKLHNEQGVVRITSSIRMGTRTDRSQSIEEKVKSVETKL